MDTLPEKMMKYFECKDCDAAFPRKSELIQHRKEHWPESDDSDNSDDEETPRYYKCAYEDCDKRVQTRAELVKHQWIHRRPVSQVETEDNVCDICNEFFWFPEELRNHMMDDHDAAGHSASTTYQCPYMYCTKQFDSKAELSKHTETDHPKNEDDQEQDVQCDECAGWFKSRNKLREHKMDDHNQFTNNGAYGKYGAKF